VASLSDHIGAYGVETVAVAALNPLLVAVAFAFADVAIVDSMLDLVE